MESIFFVTERMYAKYFIYESERVRVRPKGNVPLLPHAHRLEPGVAALLVDLVPAPRPVGDEPREPPPPCASPPHARRRQLDSRSVLRPSTMPMGVETVR